MSADALKVFEAGEDILASDTNDNNQYILNQITTSATQINSQVNSLRTSVSSLQNSVNNAVTLNTSQTVSGAKTFTGTTKAPTPAAGSNDTTVATTAWVRSSTAKMPNYSAGVNVNSPKSSAKYTAPNNGIYVTTLYQNNTTTTLYINNVATSYVYREGATDVAPGDFTIPLSKGDVIYWNPECWAQSSKFYPYK